ncbi:hypothetical protein GSI_12286 [Ganoderma sinense ZZ0214-1]|uniref:BTB domain-containing protein n=1 Tax=Ganoderma sinense ZZ0214-1 TaxID=1077348 RepID=A0A2G8RYY0_9APHY|nr:hypothetical protein GSI_12286 [Ganoderma sinense ZZ0214-1]
MQTLDARSPKRRRTSSTPKPLFIVAPGESPELPNGQEKFTRHADFWLDDGNLILLAGDTAFRVYKGLLTKNSGVFADMFATGSADATETFDSCPVVRLPDHPADLSDFLQYLMPCSKLRLCDGLPVSDFAELHAAIHLAHKYQCPDVEMRALSLLKNFYSPPLADHHVHAHSPKSPMARPPRLAAIAAANVARLTETPSMIPFALYQVSTLEGAMLDGYARRDGSIEHLSASDLRLCIDARGSLAHEMVLYVRSAFTPGHSDRCTNIEQCTMALNDIRDDMEERLGTCDILDAYKGRPIEVWLADFELCEACAGEVLVREDAERRRVWRLLPGIFGMTAKECGFPQY